MDALTIHEAAETTGWSPRMLRYIERVGLVEPARSASGYRLYGAAELQRLRTLRELLGSTRSGLGDVGFALRLRREPSCATRSRRGSRPSPSVRTSVPAADWLRWEQDKHQRCSPPPRTLTRRPRRPHERHRRRPPPTTSRSPTSRSPTFGRKEIRLAEHEMPGLMAIARGVRRRAAAARARASPARCT